MSILFKVCKAVIESTKASGGDLTAIATKIDVFYAADRLSFDEYNALLALIAA